MKKTQLLEFLKNWVMECKLKNFTCEVCGLTQKKMCLKAEDEIKKIIVENKK